MTDRGVLVVVVNHRSSRYLRRLLDSVVAEPEVAAIVVRDNGSGDDEVAAVRAIVDGYPLARFAAGGNVGFGAGVNAAVRESPIGDWTHVWVLNPDTAVRRGALGRLLAAQQEHGDDVLSPLILSVDQAGEDRIWFAGGDVDPVRGSASHGGFGRPASTAPTAYRRCGFVTGAAPLVTRAAWSALGGFAEHYFLYCEDTDLSVRAGRLGLRLGLEPTAVVEHDEGGSSGGIGPVFCFYTQRNRLWMYRGLRARLRVAFGSGRAQTRWMLLNPLRASSRCKRPVRSVLASIRGLFAGFVGGADGAVLS